MTEIARRLLNKYTTRADDTVEQFAEAIAKDAVVLRGNAKGYSDTCGHLTTDTHTCIALDFQPIRRSVGVDEIVKVLRGWAEPLDMSGKEMKDLADRVETYGIRVRE
jgi:hypothetical protein